jgi:hypothetical protein
MPDEVVNNPPVADAPVAEAPAALTAEEIAAIKAENEALKGKAAEHERAAQFWYEQAKGGEKQPEAEAAPGSDDEPDVLDLITSKGVKGLDELLAKRGYVRQDQVEATVNARAAQLSAEAQLVKDYPDLGKKDSEFFKATAAEYGELKKAKIPEVLAMQIAAERTELAFLRAGKLKTPQQAKDEERANRETERRARIAAQSGDRGSRAADIEDSDELTPEQNQAAMMLVGLTGPDGKAYTREQAVERYKARAKAGVAMKGMPGQR